MMNGILDRCLNSCAKWDLLLARILLGGMFLFVGVGKFMAVGMTAAMIAGAGLPMPTVLTYLSGSLEVIGGLAIITGFYFRYATFVLGLFTVLVTALFHMNWSGDMGQLQMTFAMKNAGIFAALLYMKIHGPGSLAFGVKKMPESAM